MLLSKNTIIVLMNSDRLPNKKKFLNKIILLDN